MKRIALLVCGLVLVVANTAEARRQRRSNYGTYYTRPVAVAPATATAPPVAAASDTALATSLEDESDAQAVAPASATTVKTVSYSTATAQGVANLMAANNRVGHWGGNPGYEGCGSGVTPAAAYAVCCYANSGMATVDVGYAQSASGMWYCCRRYR
jgi:hypothetical protein